MVYESFEFPKKKLHSLKGAKQIGKKKIFEKIRIRRTGIQCMIELYMQNMLYN